MERVSDTESGRGAREDEPNEVVIPAAMMIFKSFSTK